MTVYEPIVCARCGVLFRPTAAKQDTCQACRPKKPRKK